jgi:hypothetical protein
MRPNSRPAADASRGRVVVEYTEAAGTPPRSRLGPPGTVLGAQAISMTVNPYGKHFLQCFHIICSLPWMIVVVPTGNPYGECVFSVPD